MKRRGLFLSLCLLLGVPCAVQGQLVPVGSEFQIAPVATGFQERPEVAIADDGSFIVAWCRDTVDARRFAADATPLDSGFQFPDLTTLTAFISSVTMAADGSFIAVWIGNTAGTTQNEIQARRFGTDGSPLAPQFQVNDFTTGYQGTPSVATGPDGEFVVSWTSVGSPGNDTDYESVQARPYDDLAVAQSAQFQVNSRAAWYQRFPAVDFQPTGDYVVVWEETGGEMASQSCHCVNGRRLDANGIAFGPDFRIDRRFYSTGAKNPDIAVTSDGGFLVTWVANSLTGNDPELGIFARKYDAAGVAAEEEFQVNTVTTGFQRSPSVAATPDGGFLVAWYSASSEGDDSDGDSIQARRYDANAQPFGSQMQINTVTTGNQRYPSVAIAPGGEVVIAWQTDLGNPPFTDEDVVAHRFLLSNFIGNRVWSDRNRDGIQDSEEASFPNVTVELFQDGNPVAIDTTVTDIEGLFGFADLAPGQYRLRFIAPTPTTEISPQSQGTDPSRDSDPDPVTGFTASFSLAAGEANTRVDAGMLETRIFIDGFDSGSIGAWTASTPP